MQRLLTHATLTAALAAVLGGCAGTPPAAAPSPSSPSSPSLSAPQQLQAYQWDLQAAFDAQGQPSPGWQLSGRPAVRLAFQADRLSAQNLCNVLGAGYALTGTQMTVGRPVATMRACAEPGLMALERRVAEQLPRVQRYELRPGVSRPAPVLVLHFSNGERWELAGTPTPATRYGSAGERVFLEVAPQRVACNHPLMPNATCLRVRDVQFDAQGLKQSVGEWRIFQGEIEGYTHRPGVRNVLRLQRYSLARNGQAPADGPRHAYVLDMVVESEQVR